MVVVFVCAIALVVVFLGLKAPRKAFNMGRELTRMTNVFEEIERTRYTMPIGAGGGIDSLAPGRQLRAKAHLEQGCAILKDYPRHEVTRELLKNMILNERLGRPIRVAAINRLILALVQYEVALSVEEFERSYC